jgi:hypothetical protein
VSDSDLVGLGLARLAGWLSTPLHGTGTDLTARLAAMNRPSNALSTAPVLPCMTVERTPDDPCTR